MFLCSVSMAWNCGEGKWRSWPELPSLSPSGQGQEPQGPHVGQLGTLTRVMSREAAAALMCRLGWRTELLQSRARAKVPTELGEGTG